MRFKTNGCIQKKINLLDFLLIKFRNIGVFILWTKWLCYQCLSVYATAQWFLSTLLFLWNIPDAVQQSYPNLTMFPLRCLLPFVSTYLYKQGWMLEEANEIRLLWATLFSEMPRALFQSFTLRFFLFFFGHGQNFFEMTKKIKSIRSWCSKRYAS